MSERKATAGAGSGKLPLSLFGLHEGESNGSKLWRSSELCGGAGEQVSPALDQSFASATGSDSGESGESDSKAKGEKMSDSGEDRIVKATIPNYAIESFEAEIERINKRLAKKGIEARIFALAGESKLRKIETPTGKRIKIEATDFSVLLPELKLPGKWELIGALDHESTNGKQAIVKSLPGKRELPGEFREISALRCDHCKRNVWRKDTFAIESGETGEILIVGRNCIADFLGIDPSGALYVYDLYDRIRKLCSEAEDPDLDRFGGSYRGIVSFEAGEFLEYSAKVIRSIGYLSKAKAEAEQGIPTADLIWDLMLSSGSELRKRERDLGIATGEDHDPDLDLDLAQASLVWLFQREAGELDRSEYLRNLQTIAEAGIATFKTKGYLASLISVYLRDRAKQAEREAEAERGKASEHIGEIKKRERGIVLTLRSIRYFEGYYGATYLVKLTDPEGNDLVWFASFDPQDRGYKIGESYKADFTVKAHDTFKGSKQTKINRVSFSKAQ